VADIVRKISSQDIEEGKGILGLDKKFSGSTVLDNPYLADICCKMTGDEEGRPESLNAISDWLKVLDRETGVKCYVSVTTLAEFRNNWFIPLRNKAIDGMLQEGFSVLSIAGMEFKKEILERDGIIGLRKKELEKIQGGTSVVPAVSSSQKDPMKELVDYLEYCKAKR